MRATTPSTASSPLVDDASPSKDCDAPVGTLWTTISSPLCTAILAVAHISRRRVRQCYTLPVISHVIMWLRFRIRAAGTNSIVLHTTQRCHLRLCNAFQIAHHVDSVRRPNRPTLFPPHLLSHICLFEAHARAIVFHMQITLLPRLQHDVNAAQLILLPPNWRHRFFSLLLVKIYLWWLKRECGAHCARASREHATKALNAVRAALSCYSGKHLRYLCGESVTFADVVVAESIFFDVERYARCADMFRDEEFAEAFPDVVAWARALRNTHYAAVVSDARR